MKLFFDDAQLAHKPTQYMRHGKIIDAFENPARATTLIEALGAVGAVRETPGDFGLDPVLKVHADHYVAFLETAYERFVELYDHGVELLPSVSPYVGAAADLGVRDKPRTTGVMGQAGWYIAGLSNAMMANTYAAAYASAQTAAAGAAAILAGERAAYSLCRPPGHHAYIDRGAGFCFFNNAAIAAEILREQYSRVAIIDFDTHHGDGTQSIFYRRADVFFGSVHTDPHAYYPHYFGYADETGAGVGEGANLNLPLAEGGGDEAFVEANRRLADAVRAHGAQALVISAGWDAHGDDPLSRQNVTTDAYARIGEIWGGLAVPSLIVQEGGYSLAAVAEAAPGFVGAFRAASGV